jgi:hypothetical protein
MCGPLFLTIAGIGLMSVGTCLGFLTAALFASGAEPAQFAKPEIAGPHRRIGLAGRRKPLRFWFLLARSEGPVWAHGGCSACAPPPRRLLPGATANGPSRDRHGGDAGGRAVRAPYHALLCHSTHVFSGSNEPLSSWCLLSRSRSPVPIASSARRREL